ncbi:phage tail tape measure protein [Vibrio vulnificus]
MSDAKYQIAIAAVDQYSAPFRAASASVDKLTEDVKEQSAELKQLNSTARSIDTYAALKRDLQDTSVQLDQAKTKTGQLAVEFKQLDAPTKAMRSELEAAERELSKLETQLKSTDKPTKEMRAAVRDAKSEVKYYSEALQTHEQRVESARKAYDTSRRDVSRLTGSYEKQQTSLHQLKGKLNESGIQAHKFGDAQRKIRKDIAGANAALETQRKKLAQVKTAQANIESNRQARSELTGQMFDTAVKGAALAIPIKFAVDFESAFADVKKAVNDATPEELEVMRQRVIAEAPQLGVSQEGLAGIIAEGGRNGIAKDELFNFAESAAKMSVAFDMTADEAGASMMKWRTTMNLSQDQAVNLANAVNFVGDNMATTAKDITEVLVRQGAVITNAGLDEVQAASLSAAVLSGSASTEIAATATKNLLLSLTAGDSASGTQKDALASLGFDPAQLAKDMQENAPQTVEQVLLAIKDQDADVQTALMKSLFGSESIGSIAPLLQNLENFRKAFKLVEKDTNFAGSMQKEFDVQAATAQRKISAFTASVTGLFTVLGDSMLPVVGDVLDVVTPAIQSLTAMAVDAPGVTAALMAVPAALIAVKTAAIAFKAGKLLLGQGKNYADLGKAKLGMGLDDTAQSATRATSRLQKLNQAMDRLGGDSGRGRATRGRNAEVRNRKRPTRSRSTRRRGGGKLGRLLDFGSRALDFLPSMPMGAAPVAAMNGGGAKGKWGKRAAVLGGGTALSLMTSSANAADLALMGADAATMAGDAMGALPLKGMMAGAAGVAGKVFKPLNIMLQGAALTSAINNGSAEEIGSTAGDMAGGLGGAALGATIGTAILPGIGTVIGGALGGLAGGEVGDWLGSKVGGWFSDNGDQAETKPDLQTKIKAEDKLAVPPIVDKLPSPESVANKVTQSSSRQIVFSPQITIPPSSGNEANDEAMVNKLVERLKAELLGVMSGNEMDVRLDASLTDRSEL